MTNRGQIEYESFENLLSRVFEPVEPPARMYEQIENRLSEISMSAAEELSDWELAAMRDPRNWVRPAVALTAGGVAAGTLLVLGLRQRHRQSESSSEAFKAFAGAAKDAADGARDELRRAARDLTS